MTDKTVLFITKESRQRINIIKATHGYKTQDEVVNAALDALEAAIAEEAQEVLREAADGE